MRDIIQRHNRLNGLWFSIIEFGFIAAFVGAFAIYYLIHQRWGMALIGWGIVLNCVAVVVYGLRQWRQAKADGRPAGSYFSDRQARERHRQENPHMLRDTLMLTIGTILPFVSLAGVILNLPRPQKQ